MVASMLPADLDGWQIAELLPGAVLLVDLDGRLAGANGRGRKILGASSGEIRGRPLTQWIEESEADLAEFLRRCARGRQLLPGSLTVRTNGGGTKRVQVSGARAGELDDDTVLVMLWAGGPDAAASVQRFSTLNETIEQLKREVLARRRAEALLEAEKRVLAMIANGVPLEEALLGLARSVEDNTAGMFVSLLLLDDEGRLRHAASPSLPDRYSEAIDGVAIGPNVGSCGTAAYLGETVIVSDIDNDPRWADFREVALRDGLRACWSTPVRSSAGEVLGTLALYYRSVREPTPPEIQLIENSAHIASIAIESHRSKQQLTEMLEREHAELERVEAENRAKDQFLAMLSHELRNPLGAVANAAYALDALGGTDDERARLQAIVLSESQMLKRILDDLLDLSRLSAGKLALTREPVEIGGLLDELLNSIRISHADREISFEKRTEAAWVDGDRARLVQSVQNLVDNALKYSDPDKPIEIELTADEDEVNVSVSDSGTGIDPAILPSVFEPFVQSDVSLARSKSGLGLGLALVRRFAELHGGAVAAHSEGHGKGSRFVLTLPRASAPATSVAARSDAIPSTGTSRRVLVVEDNAGAREGLCRLLQIWGHQVSAAADGEEALRLVKENPPEVALVDIGLPVLDGYELARAIRNDPSASDVQLVALTGYGQQKDRERTAAAGFEQHLVKPVDLDDLTRIFGTPAA